MFRGGKFINFHLETKRNVQNLYYDGNTQSNSFQKHLETQSSLRNTISQIHNNKDKLNWISYNDQAASIGR